MDQAAVPSERESHIWYLSQLLSSAIIEQKQPSTRHNQLAWLMVVSLISEYDRSRDKDSQVSFLE